MAQLKTKICYLTLATALEALMFTDDKWILTQHSRPLLVVSLTRGRSCKDCINLRWNLRNYILNNELSYKNCVIT